MQRPRSKTNVKQRALTSRQLYDRLERAVIALEYALADARAYESARAFARLDRIARSNTADPGDGQEALLSLQTAALQSAARRAAQWD